MSKLFAAAALAVALSAATPVDATIISFQFTGSLVGDNGGPAAGLLPASIGGEIGFDLAVPDANLSPAVGEYVGAAGNFSLNGLISVPGFGGPSQILSQVQVVNGVAGDELSAVTGYDIGGGTLFAAVLQILGSTALLGSDAIPSGNLALAEVTAATLSIYLVGDGTTIGAYQLTSFNQVPAPAPLALMLVGVTGLALARRRAA